MTLDSKESALSRWSRRKLEADQLTQAVEESISPDAQTDLPAVDAEAVDVVEKPVLTDADMPAIESLNEDSDFSGFMSSGVSDELRNLALRKLFKAPVFNIRDGLDEYDEDYTYFEKLGDIVTCDMKHAIEMKEKKRREALAAEAEHDEMSEVEHVEHVEEVEEVEEVENDELAVIETIEHEHQAELNERSGIVVSAVAEPKPKPKLKAEDEQ